MSIPIVRTVGQVRAATRAWKQNGLRVGLVPTMGYLHQGHIALVSHALKHSDRVVLSIFVNPTQFGPSEDFDRYPRDENGDHQKATVGGAHLLFCPYLSEMYPKGAETYVSLDKLPQHLCGPLRPGHFRGVATICTKLFSAIEPDVAVFGEKDYQQAVIIRRMATDLLLPVQIETAPTVREPDGLAMSSRNVYLTDGERKRALCIVAALNFAESQVQLGYRDAVDLRLQIMSMLESSDCRPEYVEFVHPENLNSVNLIETPTVLAIAAFIGKTRLIDNRLLLRTP